MKFSLYIAKRYLFTKSTTNAINVITFIAMFGVVVGTLALFVILSAFSGLRGFSDTLLEASDPDVKILPTQGKYFTFSSKISKAIDSKNIIAASKVVEERAFIRYKNKQEIAQIKGVDTFYNEVVSIDSSLAVGNWLQKKYTNTAVVGYGIAYKLSMGIYNFGEALELYVPKKGNNIHPTSIFKTKKTQVVGVYNGSEEFQNKYVYTNIALAQELLELSKNKVSAIEIKVKEGVEPLFVKELLQEKLGHAFTVKTRKELNALYYKVVNTENFISYLIFTLILVVALFNVVGSVIMMLIEKKNNLKTLFNLGASLKQIKQIFVLQGFLLSLLGMVIGMFLAIVLVLIQQKYGVFMITDTLPYPVVFTWTNVFVVFFTINVLGYLASILASSRMSVSFLK